MNQSCSSPKFVARALSAVRPKMCSAINRITAALVLSACVVAAAQSDSPAFVKFKREMMPKVGQKITVMGTWSDREKQCCWLAFNKWGAYVYAAKESGMTRERELFAHFRNGQTVKVTGTLRYYPGPPATREGKQHVQYAPEHFSFDAAEVKVSHWSPPAPKNPKPD